MKNLLPFAALALIPSLSFAQVQQAGLDPDSFTTLPSPPLVTQPASKFFGSGRAAGVTIDTTGSDTFTTADFYGIMNSGTEPISSVTIDISVWVGAFFDFDGGGTFGGAVDPVIGAIGGMAVGDVTWTYDAFYDHPLLITATMTPPMAPGAFFRFGADTDFFISDPCPGGNFGIAGASVKVVYSSGVTDGDVFTMTSATSSEVVLGSSFTLTAGGVPGTVMSFGAAGATPTGPVVLVYAFGLGAFSGTNPFTGTVVTSGLSSFGFTVATVGVASAAGDFSYSAFVPAGAAGLVYVQALDGLSDTFSNIVGL